MRILMIVTSNGRLGTSGKKTGLWLEELAAPYHEFHQQGYEIDIASPQGGEAPVDPRSLTSISALFTTYISEREIHTKLQHTMSLTAVEQSGLDYDACFIVGGHGIMWDGPGNKALARILSHIFEQGRVVAAVCHGPAALVDVRLSDGEFLVKGRQVNSATNEEESAMDLETVVPFLLESKLKEQGAIFQNSAPNQPCVIADDNLLTGQNPSSAAPLARKVIEILAARTAHV